MGEPSSRLAERRVGLRYFGHSAFLWTTPSGVRILIDPFGNAVEPRGFMGEHARHFGKEFGQRNVIFTVQTAGLTFCHTSDNRAELPEGMPDVVEKVDVLMVPVDEANHLLTHREVDDVVRALDPSIVIPTHYRVPSLTDPSTPLGGIGSWLALQPNVRFIRAPHVELSLSNLPAEREVWAFEGYSDANRPG